MLKTATGGIRTALFLFQILYLLPTVSLAQTQAPPGDRVAAVNGASVYTAEFEAALHQALQPWATAKEDVSDDRLRALRKEVLENLIGRRLAYQESRRLGIEVDDGLIDREMERVAARFSKAADFEEALNGADLPSDRLRLQFRQDIAIRLLLEEQVLQHIEVNDRELRAFYDNNPNLFKTPALVKASHIFIAAGPDSTREKRQEAVALLRAIQEQLAQGVAFAELAIDYSQCSSSENGGDLGYFEKEKMIKGFADAAFALNPGEVSDIVRTGQGYHLIMVEDRKPKMKLAFEDVREKLRQNLKIEKAARDIKVYLQTLRDSAEVEIFLRL
jgi:peptidyl-prolyl cis-trans isomerase C